MTPSRLHSPETRLMSEIAHILTMFSLKFFCLLSAFSPMVLMVFKADLNPDGNHKAAIPPSLFPCVG